MTSPQTVGTDDAGRRTGLAIERTQLAWWRTGLTSLAVAIGIGRVVPELSDSATIWPYTVVGIMFAAYGIALFWHGTQRARAAGRMDGASLVTGSRTEVALAITGPVMGLVVIGLIAIGG
jgi:putative membrane protein